MNLKIRLLLTKLNRIIVLMLYIISKVYAQELNCSVQVNHSQIQGSEKDIYETLRNAIYEFMNNRRWTNHNFKVEEKIECSILLNLTERPQTDVFKGTLQIQSRRPVYKTSYNTSVFNHLDKDIQFQYIESQPLDYSDNTFMGNLTAILAYYAYIIIGLDYDTYGNGSGSEFFTKAQNIVNMAQNTSEPGWKAFESQKNRYWLIENLTNQNYKAFHDCLYKYHRLGLDVMSEKTETGRSAIAEALTDLLKLKRSYPNLFYFSIFFSTKSDEIVNIFSGATDMEKNAIIKTLNELDPSNISKYQKIKSGK